MEALTVLGDQTRREIVALLAAGEQPAGQIAERFAMSRPAVSRHLRVLREAGLIAAEVRGQQRIYALEQAPFDELAEWVAQVRGFWTGRLSALDTEITRGKRVRRQEQR